MALKLKPWLRQLSFSNSADEFAGDLFLSGSGMAAADKVDLVLLFLEKLPVLAEFPGFFFTHKNNPGSKVNFYSFFLSPGR